MATMKRLVVFQLRIVSSANFLILSTFDACIFVMAFLSFKCFIIYNIKETNTINIRLKKKNANKWMWMLCLEINFVRLFFFNNSY